LKTTWSQIITELNAISQMIDLWSMSNQLKQKGSIKSAIRFLTRPCN